MSVKARARSNSRGCSFTFIDMPWHAQTCSRTHTSLLPLPPQTQAHKVVCLLGDWLFLIRVIAQVEGVLALTWPGLELQWSEQSQVRPQAVQEEGSPLINGSAVPSFLSSSQHPLIQTGWESPRNRPSFICVHYAGPRLLCSAPPMCALGLLCHPC